MVVQRRHPENSLPGSIFDPRPLEPEPLYQHRKAFHEEDTAQHREHKLFSQENGADTDDAADGKTSSVTHEHLSRIGVVPQEP